MEKINYSDIMDLGFTEEIIDDPVYFNEHGFEYSLITKKLTENIYLDWEKETKECSLIRIDHPSKGNILGKMKLLGYDEVKRIIYFFEDK